MQQEYSFTLTIPVADVDKALSLLDAVRERTPTLRISRKTDRAGCARFYLSFPFTVARPDLAFEKWFAGHREARWDLFGPTYGRWGFR